MTTSAIASEPTVEDTPYGQDMWYGAALATVFVPLLALIAALIMRDSETRPARRAFLKRWATWSAAWMATLGLIGLVLLLSVIGAHNPRCDGGLGPLKYYSSTDGTHWVGTYACVGGGQTTRPVPAPAVPTFPGAGG